MDSSLRRAFNANFSTDWYKTYLSGLERRLGCPIPFRVAETPLFIPDRLRERVERAANEIVELISVPVLIERMKRAIPRQFDVPGMDALPNCAQVDLAIVRGQDGELEGRVVELQAFPSLYCLMVLQSDLLGDLFQGVSGLERRWSIYFGGLDRDAFVAKLRQAVLAGESPEHIVLLDLDPPAQKTYPDFAATKILLGVDAVCPTELVRDGRKLFRRAGGKLVPVRRIYNRIVFDELEAKKVELPFSYNDELDVSW